MKRLAYLLSLTLVLVGCGSRSGFFKLEGHLLNLNQGEFYVYSTDGAISGVDTIKVEGGRFAYETPCTAAGTIVIVFPNYSEQPVFVVPGASVTISGDATHLKEMEVKGTDENKIMTAFRQQTASASPPEVTRLAAEFIKNNANTLSAVYVLRRFFVTDGKSDLAETAKLVDIVNKAQPKNGIVARMGQYVRMMKNGVSGAVMPQFTAKDIKDKTVTTADTRGKITVVMTWATWNYDSKNAVERVKKMLPDHKNRLALITINLDASRSTCSRTLQRDSTTAVNICDELMFDSPLLDKFALTGVPDNILFNAQGRITDRGLTADELETRLKTLLN